MTRGEDAERRVLERLVSALPPEYRVYPNVAWCVPRRHGGAAADGEADAVICHPKQGILVIEVKAGEPSRDAQGRWWLGPVRLDRSPFDQARRNKYDLADRIAGAPAWPHAEGPVGGYAVAFPDVDLSAPGRAPVWMGLDAPPVIVLDATALAEDASVRTWVAQAFAHWNGDGATRGVAPGPAGMTVIDDLLAPTVTLRRRLHGRIQDDRADLVALSREQLRIVNLARRFRRLDVVGPAGSGKSMLAVERSRQLASEGFRTLLVCYNQRLATSMARDLADASAPAGLTVTTFHRLCEQMATLANVLPPRPSPIPQDWWDLTLPDALLRAIDALPEDRYHAIVVDEGQDFAADWLQMLDWLLVAPGEDVLWVFHDPGQALYRDDVVSTSGLGLQPMPLLENHRNPLPVAERAARFYKGEGTPVGYRSSGIPPRIIAAAPGHATLEALRRELHRLTVDEGVRPWDIAVLSGRSATQSDVWRQKVFGAVALGNAALDVAGRHLGLPPERIGEDPSDAVLFETIRRFKGMEAPVVVLVELPEDDAHGRIDELLYVGLTRATTSLTVIAPEALAKRLR